MMWPQPQYPDPSAGYGAPPTPGMGGSWQQPPGGGWPPQQDPWQQQQQQQQMAQQQMPPQQFFGANSQQQQQQQQQQLAQPGGDPWQQQQQQQMSQPGGDPQQQFFVRDPEQPHMAPQPMSQQQMPQQQYFGANTQQQQQQQQAPPQQYFGNADQAWQPISGGGPTAPSQVSRGVDQAGNQFAGAPGIGTGGYGYEPLPAAPPMKSDGAFGQPYEGSSFQMSPPSSLSGGANLAPYGAGYGPSQGQLPQSVSHMSGQAPPMAQGPGFTPHGSSMQMPDHRSRSLAGPTRTLSSPTYTGPECNDECAEEGCDPEVCGDENSGPKSSAQSLLQHRLLLPVSLSVSALVQAVWMMAVEVPILRRDLGHTTHWLDVPFYTLYIGTVICMLYCAVGDPGQMKDKQQGHKEYKELAALRAAQIEENGEATAPDKLRNVLLPRRAHKTWLYEIPIRRYSHYCRWLCNCVGLMNHREYILMCTGVVAIGFVGAAVGAYVVLCSMFGLHAHPSGLIHVAIFLHMAYCGVLVVLGFPILRIHVGLVSRNELASEWKNNEHDVIYKEGKAIPVNELEDEEFNLRFDSFVYDRKRNEFDRGLVGNCMSFWCKRRWCSNKQLGDF